jgi:hypothetical protein
VDLSCNAHRIERTYRDIRLDGTDHYGAIFQFADRSTVVQNDRVTELTVGDVDLVDSTQPVTYISENRPGRWLGLNLPRQSLMSHLGLEPLGGLRRHGETPASRLLFGLIRDQADERDLSAASADPYMQFAIYDLIGALFASSDGPSTLYIPTSCSNASAASSRAILPIPISILLQWPPKRVFHCVICRSYSRCAAQPAAIPFIRCGLIMSPVLSSGALRRRLNSHLA